MSIEIKGLFGFIVLLADIYAIISVVRSGTGTGKTVGWIALIIILPIAGWIIWFFAGPRARTT